MTPAQQKIKHWRENPVAFVVDNFGVEPDEWQVDALMAFADPARQRLSLQACAGPGKSAVLAWCGLNFISCYAATGEHPNAAAVSITGDNLRDNLWKEFAKWIERSPFLSSAFKHNADRIVSIDHPKTWFISARSFPKTANDEEMGRTLSGLHSRYILYLIDESGDIKPSIQKSAEQGLSRCAWGKILQAGNPTSHDGMLYAAATAQRHLWHVTRITGDPDDPKRSPRINIDWAREQIRLYGRDDPWVMAYILGQFPPSSINALLSLEEAEAAADRHLREDQYSFAQKRMGIDAARFGDDPWVIFPRQGLAAFTPVIMRGPRSHDVAARVAKGKADWGSEVEFFDGTGGYASGAVDCMMQGGHTPIEVQFSGKPDDPRYFNKRSEIGFRLANWVRRGGAVPRIPNLITAMTGLTYTFVNGKFRLEEKERFKERFGFSPNEFDALALTFSWAEMPAATNHPRLLPESARVVTADTQESARRGPEPRLTVLRDGDPFA